jgi:hypothetical protein
MIFDYMNIDISDDEWIEIIKKCLVEWTETPLSSLDGCDMDDVRFFDGLFGTLLKQTERITAQNPAILNKKFVDSWKYQGKLYRVMHEHMVLDADGNYQVIMPEVNYHGMITHWTDDYTFEGLLYKLSPDDDYIVLEADTQDHFAFDVNRFRKKYQCGRRYTDKEREFIFPMYKESIKEYHMSINEFANKKKKGVL